MSELARCTRQRNGRECGENLRFEVRNGRVVEFCPVCDWGERPRKQFESTVTEEVYGGQTDLRDALPGEVQCEADGCSVYFKPRDRRHKTCSKRCHNRKHNPKRCRAKGYATTTGEIA